MKSYKELTKRYLKANKKRTILTIGGIALSVALIFAIGSLLESLNKRQLNDTIKSNGNYHAAFMQVTKDQAEKLKNSVEVKEAGVSSTLGYAVIHENKNANDAWNNKSYVEVKEYDDKTFNIYNVEIEKGNYPKNSNEIVLPEEALNIMGKSIGDTIELETGEKYSPENDKVLDSSSYTDDIIIRNPVKHTYTIVGIRKKTFAEGPITYRAITHLDDIKAADRTYNVSVIMKKHKHTYATTKQMAENLSLEKVTLQNGESGYNIDYNENLLRLIGGSRKENYNDSRNIIISVIIGLVIVSTVATIYNSFHISVMERKKEFGTLRSVGATPSQIRGIVFREGFFMAAVAIPIGITVGYFGLWLVLRLLTIFLTTMMNQMELAGMGATVTFRLVIITVGLSMLTVFLSAYLPAKKAGRISPIEAIRSTTDIKVGKLKSGKLSSKLFKAEGYLASRNLRRNKKKFRITIFSITISIVLFIVFNSFVSLSLKVNSFTGTYTPDYSCHFGSTLSPSEDEIKTIKSFKGVEKVYTIVSSNPIVTVDSDKLNPKADISDLKNQESDPKGKKINLHNSKFIYPGEDGMKELKKNLSSGEVNTDALEKENGVILFQTNLSRNDEKSTYVDYTEYKVGDYIEFYNNYDDSQSGKNTEKVKVMGIMEKPFGPFDYNQQGVTMFTTKKVLENIKMDNGGKISSMAIETSDDEDEGLKPYLKELTTKNNGYFNDTKENAKEEKQFQIMIQIFLYGFVAVISLISSINIINTITTNVLLRKKELSMLQAVGMTTKDMHKSIYLESLFCTFTAWIYGTIIGTGISYFLYKTAVRSVDFKWDMPLGAIFISLIGAIIISLIAGVIPINKLKKENIIENIRRESI